MVQGRRVDEYALLTMVAEREKVLPDHVTQVVDLILALNKSATPERIANACTVFQLSPGAVDLLRRTLEEHGIEWRE